MNVQMNDVLWSLRMEQIVKVLLFVNSYDKLLCDVYIKILYMY